MRTITQHSMIVEHDGHDYEVPITVGPVADWIDPIVSLNGNELKVTYLALDEGYTDSPLDDYDGAEFKLFDSGHQRNDWIDRHVDDCGECEYDRDEHTAEFRERWGDICDKFVPPDADVAKAIDDGRFFWVERYEHGMVRYALPGESSQVDRQWDVASACAYLILDDEWFGGDSTQEQRVEVARSLLEEYTSWCNGDVYGIVHVTIDATTGALLGADSCWGYIGSDCAEAEARAEH